ncbi:MAG: threonine synthase [Saprospiraceae bacterium]|jgi:threonine synthase
MIKYISNRGGVEPVDFETAILDGFAGDGGLYVPEMVPQISLSQLEKWKNLSYVDLAFEVLSLYMDRSIMSADELKNLLQIAYAPFTNEEVIPLHKMQSQKDTYIMELFHGPTISFKDVGLAFLVNLVNFFLERKKEKLTLIVATTGDTGPATAYFAAGKSNLDTWVLYPKGMITDAQERQMTTLPHANIHPVGVSDCPDGCDDLDLVIAKLYANKSFKEKLQLSSVNSINWGRIMMQTVHYIYGYLQVCDEVGEEINISVPSGAFGNLCAGGLARKMGLPIANYVVANNTNACLNRIFSEGIFTKEAIIETPSNAIDILIPYNFWRFLHFATDGKIPNKINAWVQELEKSGAVKFDQETYAAYSKGFLANSASDEETLRLIKKIYETEDYLLDPHSAVAVVAADKLKADLRGKKLICLATAHPAKFSDTIRKALDVDDLPESAKHFSVEAAKTLCEKVYLCHHDHLEESLIGVMEANFEVNN